MFKTQRIPKHPLFLTKIQHSAKPGETGLLAGGRVPVEKEQDVKASDYLN